MAEGMLLLDEGGVIIDCNKNAEYIFGSAQDSLIGTAFISLEHLFVREDEEAPFSPAALSIMITQRSAQPVHNVVLGVDNPRRGVVWISLNAQPVFDRSGQRSQGTVVTFNDISSRKHLEDELRLTTEQYRAVVEDQTELICRFRTTGEITFVNEAYCRYFAKRQNDLIGSRFLPFISKKDKQSLWPRIEALSADSRSCLIEQRLKLPGGSTRWTQWSITALISNGTVYEYQGVGRDIHEIKELQDTVKQNQYVLQSVVNGISDPLYMVDRKYRVKMANQATMDYYGVTADRVIGQQCYRVFMDAGTPCADCVIFRQNSRLQPKTFERSGRLDQHTYEQVTIYPLSQKKADLMSAIIHIKDITKTKMLEKRIGQSERLASLGLLISGITHEINNPNNFITFNIPVLRDYISTLMPIADDYASRHENFTVYNMPYNEFRQDLYRLIDNMEHGSERITRTVSSLREFIRNEGSGAISKVQIKEVIDKAITLCGTKIKKAARSFSVDIAPDIGIIHTDPQALEHVIIILLVNAAEASDKQDSLISITARAGSTWQERVIIDVVDNGCGIEQEHIEKVFEPFFTTKSESGGTGLGMYICRDIIKGIGGAVSLDSTPGEGTTVRLVIPDIHEE
jgi:PAS domain S-box-containing protein